MRIGPVDGDRSFLLMSQPLTHVSGRAHQRPAAFRRLLALLAARSEELHMGRDLLHLVVEILVVHQRKQLACVLADGVLLREREELLARVDLVA